MTDFEGFNHERRLATVGQLLDLLLRQRGHDAAFLDVCGRDPDPASICLGLLPAIPMPLLDPKRAMLISLWLGNRTRTAAHWDLPQNLACVVAGRRKFTLFPTDQLKNLYVGPLDFTLAGQPTSLVDLENPDFERHPRFARGAGGRGDRRAWAGRRALHAEPVVARRVLARRDWRDGEFLVARRRSAAPDAAQRALPCGRSR